MGSGCATGAGFVHEEALIATSKEYSCGVFVGKGCAIGSGYVIGTGFVHEEALNATSKEYGREAVFGKGCVIGSGCVTGKGCVVGEKAVPMVQALCISSICFQQGERLRSCSW
jgi:acetyltransferase-like isoleucine patch superfamily enzyme